MRVAWPGVVAACVAACTVPDPAKRTAQPQPPPYYYYPPPQPPPQPVPQPQPEPPVPDDEPIPAPRAPEEPAWSRHDSKLRLALGLGASGTLEPNEDIEFTAGMELHY